MLKGIKRFKRRAVTLYHEQGMLIKLRLTDASCYFLLLFSKLDLVLFLYLIYGLKKKTKTWILYRYFFGFFPDQCYGQLIFPNRMFCF